MIAVRATLLEGKVKLIEPEKVAAWAKSQPPGIELEVTFRKWADGRSLRANALFHELVGRYSKALGQNFSQVKYDFKHNYGIFLTAEQAIADAPPWNGRFVDYYGTLLFFKSTADFTIREFNELTKGALSMCFDNSVNIADIERE